MIPVECGCGRKLRAKDESAGRVLNCPDCNSPLAIPGPELDDPFVNPMWTKPATTEEPPRQTGNGNARFLVLVSVVGIAFLAGGFTLAHRTIEARQKAEARSKLHDSLTEAIQVANASVLGGNYPKTMAALRPVIEPKPVLEADDPNLALMAEAEALMKSAEVVGTDSNLNYYLDGLDDGQLADLREGNVPLTKAIGDAKVKKVIDDRLYWPISNIQAKRQRQAQESRERALLADFPYQRDQFLAWADVQQDAICKRDLELRGSIADAESGYRTSLFEPKTTRQIENVLDEWGGKRKQMLDERMEKLAGIVKQYVDAAMKHPVWRAGTKDDQLGIADDFGAKLQTLTRIIDIPIENGLASLERTFGDSVQRGFRQLDEDAARGRKQLDDLYRQSKGLMPR